MTTTPNRRPALSLIVAVAAACLFASHSFAGELDNGELSCQHDERYYTGLGFTYYSDRLVQAPEELTDIVMATEGVLVQGVYTRSPAGKLGLRPGHIIVSVNETTFKSADEFSTLLPQETGESALLVILSFPEGPPKPWVVTVTDIFVDEVDRALFHWENMHTAVTEETFEFEDVYPVKSMFFYGHKKPDPDDSLQNFLNKIGATTSVKDMGNKGFQYKLFFSEMPLSEAMPLLKAYGFEADNEEMRAKVAEHHFITRTSCTPPRIETIMLNKDDNYDNVAGWVYLIGPENWEW